MQKKSETSKQEIRVVVDAETIMRLRKMADAEKISVDKAAQKILNARC